MTDTPLTADHVHNLRPRVDGTGAICDGCKKAWLGERAFEQCFATITALTTRAEQAEAHGIDMQQAYTEQYNRAEGYRKALVEQGLLQKTASGWMVWHAHDCPASFDFAQCNYRCRVAREAFALAGTEPYVSEETRRYTEVYE